MIEHNYIAHEREGWSVCTRCGMVRNYDRPIAGCRGVTGNIAVRGGMTMTTVEEETATPVCSVCDRPTGFGDEDKGEPPVNLARCPAPGGMECRAVAQAVAPWRRENETLRSNCDHLSSENASLSSQVEAMAMRIESLAEELAKPEDMRLREVVDALEGRAVIFDGLGVRVTHLLDEMDEWIARAGDAERRLEDADAKLTAVRVALTESGVPEVDPYPAARTQNTNGRRTMNLEQEIIDAANEVTEAKLAVVEKEQALRALVRRVTSGSEQHEARAAKRWCSVCQ